MNDTFDDHFNSIQSLPVRADLHPRSQPFRHHLAPEMGSHHQRWHPYQGCLHFIHLIFLLPTPVGLFIYLFVLVAFSGWSRPPPEPQMHTPVWFPAPPPGVTNRPFVPNPVVTERRCFNPTGKVRPAPRGSSTESIHSFLTKLNDVCVTGRGAPVFVQNTGHAPSKSESDASVTLWMDSCGLKRHPHYDFRANFDHGREDYDAVQPSHAQYQQVSQQQHQHQSCSNLRWNAAGMAPRGRGRDSRSGPGYNP